MPTVLLTTDFSETSRHSLDYASQLLKGKDINIDLVHIFSIPVSYVSDGLSLVSMGHWLERAEDMIEDEVQHTKEIDPDIKITGRVVTGSFLETLREEVTLTRPSFIILGTAGFTDLFFGDADPLNALRSLNAPVLFIPVHAELKPIHNVAYACNYGGVGAQTPVQDITSWISFMQAKLHVVYTSAEDPALDEQQTNGKNWLQQELAPLNPDFNWVQNEDVLHGITSFVLDNNIDCVLMVPKKYGMWERLFHQSHTKAMARLNTIPIIAFHPRD